MRTLKEEVQRYVVENQLSVETEDWYRRIIGVFCRWAGCDPPADALTEQSISDFLAAKLREGRSPHYVASLRKGIIAVLRAIRGPAPVGKIRPVKCPPLQPDGWTAEEIERLVNMGFANMPPASRFKWQLCTLLAHYLGLDRCDIETIEQPHLADNGALVYRRRKTGGEPTSGVPLDLLATIRERCPRKGPICRMGISREWFRRIFAAAVARAGLFGTFKKLRKSSGSLVEAAHPGKGHKHLGNTRAVFEKHYEAKRLTRTEPTIPPKIRWQPPAA